MLVHIDHRSVITYRPPICVGSYRPHTGSFHIDQTPVLVQIGKIPVLFHIGAQLCRFTLATDKLFHIRHPSVLGHIGHIPVHFI